MFKSWPAGRIYFYIFCPLPPQKPNLRQTVYSPLFRVSVKVTLRYFHLPYAKLFLDFLNVELHFWPGRARMPRVFVSVCPCAATRLSDGPINQSQQQQQQQNLMYSHHFVPVVIFKETREKFTFWPNLLALYVHRLENF